MIGDWDRTHTKYVGSFSVSDNFVTSLRFPPKLIVDLRLIFSKSSASFNLAVLLYLPTWSTLQNKTKRIYTKYLKITKNKQKEYTNNNGENQ